GQMSVIEAQAMDMSAMKPPEGAAPVATEVVERRPFRASVTYTGTVVAYNDEDVYPRVEGWIVDMPVYPGDIVKRGQLIARLDSVELSAREREAAMARQAAAEERQAAAAKVSGAQRARDQAAADLDEATSALKASQADLTRAEAAVVEARRAQDQAEHDLSAAQADLRGAESAQNAAESELEAARSAVRTAQAELASAKADLTYWQAEIKRSKVLVDADAISVDEYQREEARVKSAQASVDEASAKIKEREAAVAAAEARVARAKAAVTAARARVQGMTSAVEQAKERVKQSQASADTARAKVEQASARVASARATLKQREADVQASRAADQAAEARARERAENLAAVATVRGYTEIRSTVGGRVIERLVSPGVLVRPGMPILRISEIDRVRLQAYVSETDLPHIRAGNVVRVTLPEDPGRVVESKVTSVFPNVDPRARTAIVEAVTPNLDNIFFPGETVTMEIETGFVEDAISVPNGAIVERVSKIEGPHSENRPAVWVVRGAGETGPVTYYCTMHPEVTSDKPGKCPKCGMNLEPKKLVMPEKTEYYCTMHPDVVSDEPGTCPKCGMKLEPRKVGGSKTARLVFVETGRTSGKRTEILSGLKEGDEVIVRGHDYLREGQMVLPTAWSDAGPVELPKPQKPGM
ncbi:MAG: heavy metal-binding domain-containing protein, partial [Armatimonadota bacterium]